MDMAAPRLHARLRRAWLALVSCVVNSVAKRFERSKKVTKRMINDSNCCVVLNRVLFIYKWIQCLPRGMSLGRKLSGVDHNIITCFVTLPLNQFKSF
jgi:hypothetical protein